MTNPELIDKIMHDANASEVELELAYRLTHAIDEINTLANEVGVLEMREYTPVEE